MFLHKCKVRLLVRLRRQVRLQMQIGCLEPVQRLCQIGCRPQEQLLQVVHVYGILLASVQPPTILHRCRRSMPDHQVLDY